MSDELQYSDVQQRLDEIVTQVKRKDLSLAESLDLLNEAIALGNQAIDLVDIPDHTDESEHQKSGDADAQGAHAQASEAERTREV